VEISYCISPSCYKSTNVYFIPRVDGKSGKDSGNNSLNGPFICSYIREYNTGKLIMFISNNMEDPKMSFASSRLNV
jgi:hypothetical protein